MATRKRVSGDYVIQTINETDVIVFDSRETQVTGDLFVTGNINVPANIVADRIVNGTSDIQIPVINGNVSIDVGGVANVSVFHTGGVNVTGNVLAGNITTTGTSSVTGNVNAGNVNTAGNVSITRDASLAQPTIRFTDTDTTLVDDQVLGAIEWFTNDVTPGARVTSAIRSVGNSTQGNANIQILTSTNGAAPSVKVTILSTGNVGVANVDPNTTVGVTGTGYFSSDFTAGANITGGNILSSGLASITGNITGGNIATAGLITVTGNITAGNMISQGAVSAGAAGVSTTGNVTGGNVLSDGIISATGNLTTTDIFATSLSATANVIAGNLSVVGNVINTLTIETELVAPSVDAQIITTNRIRSDDSSFVSIEDGLRVESGIETVGSLSANTVTALSFIQLPVYASNAARDVGVAAPQPGVMCFVTDGDGAGTPVTQIYANAGTGWQSVTVS